jgi:general secretion pathway protein K
VSTRERPDAGFALVFAIWAIGLLALLFTTYVVAARYRSVEAASLTARTRATVLANTAIKIAVFDLLGGLSAGGVRSKRFPTNGATVFCSVGRGSGAAISVLDEAGKVDLNAASEDLLRALLRRTVRTRGGADELARRLVDLRKPPDSGNTGTDAAPPPSAPRIRTIFELEQLPGVDTNTMLSLRPLVTVHSGAPGIDPTVASPGMLGALAAEIAGPLTRGQGLPPSLPPAFTTISPARVFSIAAQVETADGATAAREAIVEFSAEFPAGHKVHEWRDHGRDLSGPGPGSASLEPC